MRILSYQVRTLDPHALSKFFYFIIYTFLDPAFLLNFENFF